MTKIKRKRHVHADELRKMGFPETVIGEAVRAEQIGLFDMEPAPDLVERTIARCQNLLPSVKDATQVETTELTPTALAADFANRVFDYSQTAAVQLATLDQISASAGEAKAWGEFSRLERLPLACLATVSFARTKRKRPLMIVDNHNLISPAWWDFDSGFRALRNACRVVNTIAVQNGVAPAAVVMVMRPDVSAYSEEDIVAISELLRTATSDIWMISYERAAEYKGQDLIVLGEERVLILEHKFSSPGEAFSALREMESVSVATKLRGGIERVATRAAQIRVGGALAPGITRGIESVESVRALMNGIIVGAIPAEARG